jgi:hypothetical protein
MRNDIFGGLTMKMKSLLSLLMLVGALIILPQCGGGGGGNGGGTPTTAVLTLSTSVTGAIPATTTINGYDVTITLPAGVTVKSTTPPQTDSGVVTATGAGAGSSIAGAYAPAAGATPGKVRIIIANENGLSAGEFCKVTCDIAAGYNPSSSDFLQPTFIAGGYVHTHLGFPDDSITDTDLTGQLSLAALAVIQ